MGSHGGGLGHCLGSPPSFDFLEHDAGLPDCLQGISFQVPFVFCTIGISYYILYYKGSFKGDPWGYDIGPRRAIFGYLGSILGVDVVLGIFC